MGSGCGTESWVLQVPRLSCDLISLAPVEIMGGVLTFNEVDLQQRAVHFLDWGRGSRGDEPTATTQDPAPAPSQCGGTASLCRESCSQSPAGGEPTVVAVRVGAPV